MLRRPLTAIVALAALSCGGKVGEGAETHGGIGGSPDEDRATRMPAAEARASDGGAHASDDEVGPTGEGGASSGGGVEPLPPDIAEDAAGLCEYACELLTPSCPVDPATLESCVVACERGLEQCPALAETLTCFQNVSSLGDCDPDARESLRQAVEAACPFGGSCTLLAPHMPVGTPVTCEGAEGFQSPTSCRMATIGCSDGITYSVECTSQVDGYGCVCWSSSGGSVASFAGSSTQSFEEICEDAFDRCGFPIAQ